MAWAGFIVSIIALAVTAIGWYVLPREQSKITEKWEKEKLEHQIMADFCGLRERWLEYFRCAVDEYIEACLTAVNLNDSNPFEKENLSVADAARIHARARKAVTGGG